VELSGGEAVAAPSGRADDFSWPHGVVNVELAAPDTAAPDAGAKSAMAAERKSAMDAYAAQTGREQKPRGRKSRRGKALPGRCAGAASGKDTAAPKGVASNSRRPMVTVIRPSRTRCAKGRIPRCERAVLTASTRRGRSGRQAQRSASGSGGTYPHQP